MKKLAAALTTTALCASGLIAATGTAATAADEPGLPALTTTTTHAKGTHHGKARVKVVVTAADGSELDGKVGFTFLNLQKGKTFNFTKKYDGPQRYGFKKVTKGNWTVFVDYQPGDNNVIEGSADQTKVKVTKVKKHHKNKHHKH